MSQVARKHLKNIPQGLKPAVEFGVLMYGLKPVPFNRMGFSAVCKARHISAVSAAVKAEALTYQPCPDTKPDRKCNRSII
jgi:hypothetical protein